MDADAHRAKTLSSIAAVASAFLVFVIGGGLMLGVWASQRNDATLAASALEAERVAEAQARQSKLELEEEDARLRAEQAQAAKKAKPLRRSRRTAKSARSKAEPVRVKSSAKADPVAPAAASLARAKSSKASTKIRSGKGKVLVYGDATRVRLMGSSGTYGAGSLPSGSYTIQATFPGFDPRMAGAVEVNNGDVVSLMCSSSTKSRASPS